MKITISKKINKEIELPEFPFYIKKGKYQYFKILNEKTCIALQNFGYPSIQDGYPTSLALEELRYPLNFTEQEFMDIYRGMIADIEKNL